MNSGRVRIYELSKELNLENKDLLAICEELSILVKSHSSTITDAEAEQIRTAAQQYHPASHSSPKSTSARQGASSHMADSKTKPPAPVTKKPQILEIRTIKPEIRPSTPQPPVPPSSHSMASSPTPPASTPQPPAKPVPPPRSAQTTPSPDLASQVEPPSESVPLPEPPAASPIAVALSPDSSESEPVAVEPAPSLASPPPRPGASSVAAPPAAPPPAAASAQRRSNLPNRPVLKQAQSGGGGSTPKSAPSPSAAGDQSGSPSAKPTRPIIVNKQSAAGSSKQPDAAASAARPQQIVELRRPRPVRSEPEVTPSARIDRPDEGIGAVPELLAPPILRGARVDGEGVRLNDRPTLPKTGVKRGKGWEEEEEVVEFPAKSAKSPAKGKRRGPDLDEDEDDLDVLLDLEDDEEGEDADAPTQVTLSLVRPPKPKGTAKPSQSKPVTAAAPRSKKSSSSSSRDRRDRREEAKVEKPAVIRLTGGITIQELSAMLTIPDTDIIRALFMKGIAATVTQTLDIETATMVAKEFDVEVETGEKESEARKIEMLDLADMDNLQRRPPVVTIMGHVDHGKTTLLDSIRKTKVAQGEAGGITQHIGAYHVDMEHNGEMQQVVFLDTPGHEAFTAMRARGARVTDIAILVVAADDGVRPQTVEAISHAKAAGVPIIVAINKIDKEEAQPERVKQELTEYALVSEDWGGETIMVPVSAMTGQNLDSLLEMILLVAEIEDLHANPDRLAKGTVIEAHLDKAKGAVATLLVQNGTLRVGDTLVAGSALGKVRAMVDDLGHQVQVASPSFAVEVLGLRDVPAAGDEFEVFADAKTGGAVAQARLEEQRRARLLASVKSTQVSLNTLSARAQEGKLKELNLVLKADVQGSVEAILGSLKQLPQGEVQVRVLFAAPGEISETDVDLAAASSAVIIGFNTTLAPGARQAADRAGVDVRDYDIIYNLLDDIRAAMEGLLEPELVEEHLGQVEVRAVFPVGRGSVAGCYVQSGKIVRNAKMRVRRGSPNGPVVFEGGLDSLKRMKEDAKEVNFGYECGIGSDDFNGWEISDSIEVYKMITKRRTLASK